MNKTKVVATIGPSTNNYERLKNLILGGMNVARINMCFADYDYCTNIKNIIDTENIKCDFENQSNFVYTTDKLEVVKIKKEVDCVNAIGFPANFVTKTGLPFDIIIARTI